LGSAAGVHLLASLRITQEKHLAKIESVTVSDMSKRELKQNSS